MEKRKLWVWQRIIFIASLAAAGNFGISLIVPTSRPSHRTILPLPQSRQQTGDSESISAKVQVLHQVEALKSAMLGIWQQEAKAKSLMVSVPAPFQGTIISEAKLSSPDKAIALTFDDGPWPKTTAQVLNILKQNHVKATFFWIGQAVQDSPQIAQQVVAEGHAVGNHTWHHWYRQMDKATAAREIDRTAEVIYKTTGVRTSLFRPPGGILNNGVADYAKKHKYVVAMWSPKACEFTRHPFGQIFVNCVLMSAKPGGIVLLHDGGGNHTTVQALPQIIYGLKKRGYRFVTVPELLEMQQRTLTIAAKRS